ncbi:MAG: alpha/beta hydrolase [Oscillospiraceae bacterium]|nr:alpha/beta hydrolase [Oscillospiraceae bacterium]
MIAHVNGIDLFYEKTGEGRPLVMVHGNSEDHTIFNEAVELLKESFTCYCPDSRSHGQSTKVGELHYEDMAEDFIAFLEALDLHDVVFYGFSDGGIIGILAAAKCARITTLITSGANLTPNGAKPALRLLGRTIYLFTKDPKMALMLREPWIGDDVLHSIKAKTLVLAGSKDLVTEKETRQIAAGIPGAELRILEGEGHGSYIVHKRKIGEIIRDFAAE